MINNYEVNFKISELISCFFRSKQGNLDFFKKMRFMYELGSGRDAIFLVLKDIEKKKGKGDVICPNYSCKAIPRAVIKAGFRPVFVDVDESLSLDSKKVRKAINKNTKAIIFYHPWGFEHSKEIIKIAKKHKIFLIEDCAQIIGGDTGNWGNYSFFSFRTSKLIGVGSGAILLSKKKIPINLEKSSKIIQAIDFLDLIFRSKIKNYPKPRAILEKIFERISFRKIGKFQKNILLREIKNIKKQMNKRVKNYNTLKKIIKNTKNFKNIILKKPTSPLYFPILCNKKQKAIKLFKKNKINATEYYSHINSDYFKGKVFGKKNSEFFSKNIINLPIHDKLSKKDLEVIIKIIIKVDKKLK